MAYFVATFIFYIIGSVLVYTLLGLSPAAVHGMYTLCTAVGEFFYHTSVRTPRWMAYQNVHRD